MDMNPHTPQATLLLAYGGPQTLEEIPEFLRDVRGGRSTSPEFIEEVRSRYAQIGGGSPLLPITSSLAKKLSLATSLPVYVGMRHWHPYIRDTIAQMAIDGISSFTAICLAPHYSHMSVGAYAKAVEEAVAACGKPMTWQMVKNWHDEPLFIDAVAANTKQILEQAGISSFENTRILFTAHSLPERILQMQDPYVEQLTQTCALLVQKLGLPPGVSHLCFQSAAKTGEPWLMPQIETFVPELAEQGITNIVVAPIGFIAEHVEVLYDLDIMLRHICDKLGVKLWRTVMLNDSAALVQILAKLSV